MKRILLISVLTFFFSCKSSSVDTSNRIKSSNFEISPGTTTLAEVIIGKFPGVKTEGANMSNSSPRFIIRGGMSINNPAYAIYDIDGQVYTQYPSFIDPQNIKSIVILKSMNATNRYGGQGRGGVIVIKMKSSQ